MFQNIFNIKDKYSIESRQYSNITYNGQQIEHPTDQLIKFHIQNIYYSDDIGYFNPEQFEPYDGELPITTDKYFTDQNTLLHKLEDGRYIDVIQYRILVPYSSDSYYLTYLLKMNDIYYKPKPYEETILNYWIKTIYSWTSDNLNPSLTPLEKVYNRMSISRTLTLTKKVEDRHINSLIAPSNFLHDENIGGPQHSISCSCCKHAHLEKVSPDAYILKIQATYDYHNQKEDYKIHIANYNHLVTFEITTTSYFGNDIYFREETKQFGTYATGSDRINTLKFDFTNNTISVGTDPLFCRSWGDITFGRGKYFVKPSYDHWTHYYPEFVTDDTIWSYGKQYGASINDYTDGIDLSHNELAVRLFQIYDFLKTMIETKLNKCTQDYEQEPKKYNTLVSMDEIYDDFDAVIDDKEFQIIIKEMLHMTNTIVAHDLDNRIVISEKYRTLYDFYNKNRFMIDLPHVFIVEGNPEYRSIEFTLITVVNRQIISYVHSDKTKLLEIASKTWPSREIIYIDHDDNENLIKHTGKQYTHNDDAYFSNLDILVDDGKIKKHVGTPYDPLKFREKLTEKQRIILDSLFSDVRSS